MSNEYPAFIQSEARPASAEDGRFHIIPAPYEKSVSYGKGTAAAPSSILVASQELESFTEGCIPAEDGIHTQPPVDCEGSHEEALARISDRIQRVFELGKFPILVGGEHTVTNAVFPILNGMPEPVGIVQFDAHADLRDSYQGSSYSHACVMRRAVDAGLPIMQMGVRSLTREEHDLRAELQISHCDAEAIHTNSHQSIQLPNGFPEKIYISFDVDVFDPSVIPTTGTPEPGGLHWYDTLAILRDLCRTKNVIGLDLVELAPIENLHHPAYTCARLLYNVMAYV